MTALALLARRALNPYLHDYVPFITLYAAVALIAIFVKLGPSIAAALFGLVGVTYWFIPPYHSFVVWDKSRYFVASVAYLLVCAVIIAIGAISRRSKAKLARAETMFQTFTENSPGRVFLKDETGRYLYVNKLSKSRFNDSVGKTDHDMFPPDLANQYRNNDRTVLLENKPHEFVETTREADGEHTWLSLKFPVIGPDGRRLLGGKSIDITDLRRAEDKVQRLQQENAERAAAELEAMRRLHEVGALCVRLQNNFQHCLDAILDAAIFVTGADKGNVQLLGQSAGGLRIAAQRGFQQEFLSFFSSVSEESSAACSAALRASGRVIVEDVTQSEIFAGQPSLGVLLRAGVRAVQSTPLMSSTGKVLGMISTHHASPLRPDERQLRLMDLLARQAADYLERKQTEEMLRAASARLQSFLDAAPTGLTRCSRDLRYLSANPAYAAIAGLPVEQIVGRPIIEVMGAKGWEMIRPYVERVLSGEPVEYERALPFSAGGDKQIHVVYTPERNSANEIVGWVASVTDITEFKRTEQRLQDLERLAAAGQLAASLAHEINNPLSAVMNAVYLLERRSELDATAKELAATASAELVRVARIVKQSLSYYRVATLPQQVDLAGTLEESLQIFSERLQRAGIDVKKKIVRPGVVPGFSDEIRQVIDNLLLNAAEATPEGGRVVVSLRSSVDWSSRSRYGLRVTIGDTGSGITRENVSRIFEPFFTTKAAKGTGLGLWVVRGIVAKHDGVISVRSRHDSTKSGTVVSILWPSGAQVRDTRELVRSESAAG